ncbi:HNH endonuclease signature motif containing protein [Nocardioides daeguensis]|uniref:HNH endonuclease signature motif containing protein n=1 Tax=Nocardioides daeguensis TaxID=908359 RepID=UPI001C487BE3|nr:HNH endonuclease signature motif containing protein [Nocardioides daeguensis]MBV6725699.1 HNH endonuclease [Nocardioides daeguensis]MCR1772786.1 HNH endonuclease [Nocardioides daeguensis]
MGERIRSRNTLVIEEWEDIAAWAGDHIVTGPEGAATITEGYLDTGIPIAGPGAPLISEFAVMELVAVLGRTPDGGKAYVGRVIECAWRLPNVYAAVTAGRLAPWRAERIADLTHGLCAEAAAFVDRQLFHASGVGWAQLERLITEAVLRFDPEQAETDRRNASDQRHFDIGEVDEHGLVHLDGLLDAADGHDLNLAVARRAEVLGKLGDESSLDVRRSKAAAELARQDLALDLLIPASEGPGGPGVSRLAGARTSTTGEPEGPGVSMLAGARTSTTGDSSTTGSTVPGRKVVLNVHLTDTSLLDDTNPFANPVGRWEEGRCPISTAQIREWLRAKGTTIIVRPVIDLADHVPVDSYEIPDRHKTRVALRDHSCRFPHCTRPAQRCDLDHARPYGEGGVTCPCNEVPLCRRHHRAKTHSAWRYDIVMPGSYVWTSPSGFRFRVDHRGTHVVHPPDE